MKKNLLLFLVFFLFANYLFQNNNSQYNKSTADNFIENKGQLADFNGNAKQDVIYYYNSPSLNIYFQKNGITYIFKRGAAAPDVAGLSKEEQANEIKKYLNQKALFYRLDMDFENANPNVTIEGADKNEFHSNYYYAHCPDGVLNVSSFKKIKYKNVYNGIDFEFYFNDGKLKYDIIVQPNSSLNQIKLNYNGAKNISLLNNEIQIESPVGLIKEYLPESFWLESNGKKSTTEILYSLKKNTITFINKEQYNNTLVIDPQISWTTYYDASFWGGQNSSIDVKGNQFILATYSFNALAPTLNPGGSAYFQNSNAGSGDYQILQFNTNGVLQWATYYGGEDYENTPNVKLDYNGNIYLAGNTESTLIPTQNAGGYYDANYTASTYNYGMFLIKFNQNGVRQWASHYDHVEFPFLDIDLNNNVYILGRSEHNPPPVLALAGAFNQATPSPSAGGPTSQDLFIIKFNSSTARIWATNLGGTCDEFPQEIKCSSDNYVNILAYGDNYYGTGIVTQNAGGYFDNTLGIGTGGSSSDRDDALIYRFTPTGALFWGTAFSGTKNENMQNSRLTTDANNNIYVYGETISPDLPVLNPGGGAYYDGVYNGPTFNPFIARFNSASQLTWCTYFGTYGLGFGMNFSFYIGFNNLNNLILVASDPAGVGGSFPVVNRPGDYNATKTISGMATYIAEFNSNFNIAWSTYYHGATDRHTLGDAALHSNSCGYELYMATRWEKYNVAATDPQWVNPGGGAYHDITFDATNQSGLITRFSKLPSTTSQSFSICSNDSVTLPGGNVVTTPGTYYDTLTNTSGCDSIITTTVIVKPASIINLNPSICSGANYTLPNGNTVNTSGVYKDTLTNINGCDSIITINLTVAPVITSTTSLSICLGTSYTLPGGGIVDSAGTYHDTLSAIGGCDSVVTTNLTVNSILTFSQNISICAGANYTLPGGSVANTNGTYIDTIKNTAGCDSAITTILTVNPVISFSQNAAICSGSNYTLPGGTIVSTSGTYYDTLTTSKGCDSIITTQLTVSSLPVITNTGTILNCINTSDTIFANTTTLNANYSWSGPGIVSGNNGSSPIVNAPGTYTVTITDPLTGCSNTSTVNVNQNITHPNLSMGPSLILTCVFTSGTIYANASSNATYNWIGPGIVSGGNTSTATVNTTGTYTVIVTDPQNGCTSSGTVLVNNNNTAPSITQNTGLVLHCNLSSGSISVATSATGASYSWTGAGIVSGATTANPTVNSSGSYTVVVTDPNNGCTNTAVVIVSNANPPVATASGSATINLGNSTQLTATGGPSYNWIPATGLSCFTCANPIASPSDTTTYCVIVTDQYGCKDTACVTINVYDECPPLNKEASIPNVFTPNGDGLNDLFFINDWNSACTSDFSLQIFDRWGIKMFETNSYSVSWDGRTTSGINAVEGVYFYIIKAKRIRGQEQMYQGTISLIK